MKISLFKNLAFDIATGHNGCRPKSRTLTRTAPTPTPTTEGEPERFRIERYHTSRYFALSDGPKLMALMVYRKGAEAIKTRLEDDARTIAAMQRQSNELTAPVPPFREQATGTRQPSQQLPLIAAEDMTAYRTTSPGKPAPQRG